MIQNLFRPILVAAAVASALFTRRFRFIGVLARVGFRVLAISVHTLMAQSICGCLGDAQVTVASVWTGGEGCGAGGGGGGALAYARVRVVCLPIDALVLKLLCKSPLEPFFF